MKSIVSLQLEEYIFLYGVYINISENLMLKLNVQYAVKIFNNFFMFN